MKRNTTSRHWIATLLCRVLRSYFTTRCLNAWILCKPIIEEYLSETEQNHFTATWPSRNLAPHIAPPFLSSSDKGEIHSVWRDTAKIEFPSYLNRRNWVIIATTPFDITWVELARNNTVTWDGKKIRLDKNVFIRNKRSRALIVLYAVAQNGTLALLPVSGERVRADVNSTEM